MLNLSCRPSQPDSLRISATSTQATRRAAHAHDELPIPDKDAEYLQRQSLAFEGRILWLTFVKVLRRDGVSH